MAILNYTTQIAVDKTVAEIQKILASHGAKSILTEYEDGQIAAVSFNIETDNGLVAFTLPANAHGVYEVMQRQKRVGKLDLPVRRIDLAQARRVAWRILKDWIEAQMALVESNQVTVHQVMMPYQQVRRGVSLYQLVAARGLPQLMLANDSHTEGNTGGNFEGDEDK